MLVAQRNRSLTRRVSEQYLLFGLSGLFCFVTAAIYLSWHGLFLNFIPASVGIPLGLLLLGSFALRRTSRWNESIERQLTKFANSSTRLVTDLKPLPASQGFFCQPRSGRMANAEVIHGKPIDTLLDFSKLEPEPVLHRGEGEHGADIGSILTAEQVADARIVIAALREKKIVG